MGLYLFCWQILCNIVERTKLHNVVQKKMKRLYFLVKTCRIKARINVQYFIDHHLNFKAVFPTLLGPLYTVLWPSILLSFEHPRVNFQQTQNTSKHNVLPGLVLPVDMGSLLHHQPRTCLHHAISITLSIHVTISPLYKGSHIYTQQTLNFLFIQFT